MVFIKLKKKFNKKNILGQDVTEMKWINDQEDKFSPFFARPTYANW
jgi:hypothetical protein